MQDDVGEAESVWLTVTFPQSCLLLRHPPTRWHQVMLLFYFSKLYRLSLVPFSLSSPSIGYIFTSPSLVISNRLLYFQTIWALLVLLRLFFFFPLHKLFNIHFLSLLWFFTRRTSSSGTMQLTKEEGCWKLVCVYFFFFLVWLELKSAEGPSLQRLFKLLSRWMSNLLTLFLKQ